MNIGKDRQAEGEEQRKILDRVEKGSLLGRRQQIIQASRWADQSRSGHRGKDRSK